VLFNGDSGKEFPVPFELQLRNDGTMTNQNLFVNKDGNITFSSFWILLGFPLLYSGHGWMALISIIIGMIMATCHAMNEMEEQDKLTIRFNIYDAYDIIQEMKDCSKDDSIIILEAAIKSLVTKLSSTKKRSFRSDGEMYQPHELEMACQEAAYIAIQNDCGSKDDSIISAAISLLALVAKDTAVRERYNTTMPTRNTASASSSKETIPHCQQSEQQFHVRIPLNVIESSLWHIQNNDTTSENDEILAAEVQRKAFLWIGALADQSPNLSSILVDEGGMDCILKSIDWFRHHCEVNNWGLWAIFNLCFGHKGNQAELVRKGGLSSICRAVRLNCDESLDVCRHGLAILFEILRQAPSQDHDALSISKVSEIRKVAIAAGLHDAVHAAMVAYPESMEVMGMGTEILASTGFNGEIPSYQPVQ
jgi:hypothetical protein